MTQAEIFAQFMVANGLTDRPYRERLLAAKAFLAGHEMLCTQLKAMTAAHIIKPIFWPDNMSGTGRAPAGGEYTGVNYEGT